MMGEGLFGWRTEGKQASEPEPVEYQPYRRYVEKQRVPVIILAGEYRIEGMMHVLYHHRALDILNSPDPFVPITAARIYNSATDRLLAERDFVALQKHHIVFLYETGQPLPPAVRAGEEGDESVVSPESAEEGVTPDASPESGNG